jgi:splicing factor 3A subunit 1
LIPNVLHWPASYWYICLLGVIDKTAEFVARSGKSLEEKILATNANNPQFAFMRAGNPYYAYYQQKIRDIQRSEGLLEPRAANGGDMEAIAKQKLEFKKRLLGELPAIGEDAGTGDAVGADGEKLEPPAPDQWVLGPTALSSFDMYGSPLPRSRFLMASDLVNLYSDVIKTTAQTVARLGDSFEHRLRGLRHPDQTEGVSYAFVFPQSPVYPLYRRLVEHYDRIIRPPKDILDSLKQWIGNKQGLLDKVTKRAQWEKAQMHDEAKKKATDEAERNAMAMIDWHEFVIVETITFDDDETLPAPLDRARLVGDEVSAQGPAPEDIEMEMEDTAPAPLPEPAPVVAAAARRPQANPKVLTQRCPRCGQDIPINEFAEHLRIETSGAGKFFASKPRDTRGYESNLADAEDVAANLRSLASRRTDIFGDDDNEVEMGRKIAEKKAQPKAIWDGHTASMASVTQAATGGMSLEAQIAALHAAKGLTKGDAAGVSSGSAPPQPPTTPAPLPPHLAAQSPMGAAGGYGGYAPPMGGAVYGGWAPPPGFVAPPVQLGAPMDGKRSAQEDLDGPSSKKSKITEEINLLPEAQFLESHSGKCKLHIQIPAGAGGPKAGTTMEVDLDWKTTVGDIKALMLKETTVAINKQNIKVEKLGFLKDKYSLAYYNIENDTTVQFSVKERGGKKK